MKCLLFFLLSVCFPFYASAQTDEITIFPESEKYYTINRFGNENAYLYENTNLLYAAPASTTQKQYWQFIPTGKEHCYYILNATSHRYIQSSCESVDAQIQTGNDPVEFQIVKNTSDCEANGYYYLASTNQAIDTSKDGTLGLNYQASTGKVVAYHIRYNRNNSYWDIKETNYDYESPLPVERTTLCKRLGIYNQPCGYQGTAWLKKIGITNEKGDSLLNYLSNDAPSTYWMPIRTTPATLQRGCMYSLTYQAENFTDDFAVTAFFDWDGDGIFETVHNFFNQDTANAHIEVPNNAALKRLRLRIRISDDGLEDADDEIHGIIYDFPIYVKSQTSTTPSNITNPIASTSTVSLPTYNIEGKRIRKDKHKGFFIERGKKKIK